MEEDRPWSCGSMHTWKVHGSVCPDSIGQDFFSSSGNWFPPFSAPSDANTQAIKSPSPTNLVYQILLLTVRPHEQLFTLPLILASPLPKTQRATQALRSVVELGVKRERSAPPPLPAVPSPPQYTSCLLPAVQKLAGGHPPDAQQYHPPPAHKEAVLWVSVQALEKTSPIMGFF